MPISDTQRTTLQTLRTARQARQFRPEPVPDELLNELLEVARWTGSSRNTQPWHFIGITDKELLRGISQIRTPINWVADAPAAIAVVLEGGDVASEAYDEGRVVERIMIATRVLGLAGGIAWFGDASQEAHAKQLLGIPSEMTARGVVAIGYHKTFKDPRPNPAQRGRKPHSEVISFNRMGQQRQKP